MREQILAHYEKHFGPGRPIWRNKEAPAFEIMLYPANEQRDFQTIATVGVSDYETKPPPGFEDARFQEFITYIPEQFEVNLMDPKAPASWLCQFLTIAAKYSVNNTCLLWGSKAATETTRPPAYLMFPWVFWQPPMMEDPSFYPLNVGAKSLHFNVPILITQAEFDFAKGKNPQVLLKKLIDHDDSCFIARPMRRCSCESQQEKDERSERLRILDMIEAEEAAEAAAKQGARKVAVRPTRKDPRGAKPDAAAKPEEPLSEADKAGKKAMNIGCAISSAIFFAAIFYIGSNAYQPMTKTLGRFYALLLAGIFWAGFPFGFSFLVMYLKSKGGKELDVKQQE